MSWRRVAQRRLIELLAENPQLEWRRSPENPDRFYDVNVEDPPAEEIVRMYQEGLLVERRLREPLSQEIKKRIELADSKPDTKLSLEEAELLIGFKYKSGRSPRHRSLKARINSLRAREK